MYLLYALTAFIFLTIIYIIIAYNTLVRNKNRMHEAWSIIDVFLKKRHDLVPSLVDTVKGYATHEKLLLEEVTRVRSEAMQTHDNESLIKSENKLTQVLERLFVIAEKYPRLKAGEHFLKLQNQLSEIENELEKARRYYNGTVRENNIYQESFPTNLVAGMFGFKKGIFFEMDKTNRHVPEINL